MAGRAIWKVIENAFEDLGYQRAAYFQKASFWKSVVVEKFRAGIHVTFSKLKLTKSRPWFKLLGLRPRLHETGTKSDRNENWNSQHVTGTKITTFSIYSPCQAIFFFIWHVLFQCQGYSRNRSEMYFVFTFVFWRFRHIIQNI